MDDDPIVAAVRKVRDDLAAAFGYDVHAIFADLRRRESDVRDRLVKQPQTQPSKQAMCRGGGSSLSQTDTPSAAGD